MFFLVMTVSMAKIDLRLQRLEESVCPVKIDDVDDIGRDIDLKTSTDVVDMDNKLMNDRDFRKKLVS